MKDPNKILEGNGKFRRHLKIRTKEDIRKTTEFRGRPSEEIT